MTLEYREFFNLIADMQKYMMYKLGIEFENITRCLLLADSCVQKYTNSLNC